MATLPARDPLEILLSTDRPARRTAAVPTASDSHLLHVFLTRGLAAVAWAIVFAIAAGDLTHDVSVGVAVLLVIYPLIDLVASVLDAGTQTGPERSLLLANATFSGLTAITLAVAATGTTATVLAVFGIWALVAGAAQLVVVLRRRGQLGSQWPLLLADGVSIIGGIGFLAAGLGSDDPKLTMLAIYAATGGIEFILQAGLLLRRRRRVAAIATAA